MFNLLLVDDEKLTLDGMYGNIDWHEIGFSEVFREVSAENALKRAEESHIDVIVSDIHLGGMDGLTLCDNIAKKWPHVKIVILSGYKDFAFAQKAVELHAVRYLVKPFLYEDLAQVAQEALDRFKKDIIQQQAMSIARCQLQNSNNQRENEFIIQWGIQGTLTGKSLIQKAQACGWEISESSRCVPICVLLDSGEALRQESRFLHISLREIARNMLDGNERIMIGAENHALILLVFMTEGDEAAQKLLHRLDNQLESCQQATEQTFPGIAPLMVLGHILCPEQLHCEWERLRSLLCRDFRLAEITGEEENITELCSLSLENCIASGKWKEAHEKIQALFVPLKEKPDGQRLDTVRSILFAFMTDAVRNGISLGQWNDLAGNLMQVRDNVTADELQAQCLQLLEHYQNYLKQEKQDSHMALVHQVEEFILEHIREDLNCSFISEAFHYHPHYLSRVLKSATGKTLNEIVALVRINYAKELLQAGHRISDVAICVGCDNFSHFSRLFRKIQGESPSQYRQRFAVLNDKV